MQNLLKLVGLGLKVWMKTFYLAFEIFGEKKSNLIQNHVWKIFLRIFIRFYSIVEYTVLIEEVGSSHISPLDF